MYRSLTIDEIGALEAQGCTAADWAEIEVSENFSTSRIHDVEFSGKIRLGRLDGTVRRPGGLERHSAIRRATLHNASIGDDAYISTCNIANYDIAANSYIENVDNIISTLDSSFGVGTEVSVLNETGGREVPVYERLSAQTAYLIAMYRNRRTMVERLITMIKVHAAKLFGCRGQIGEGAEIVNSGSITNVNIGPHTQIEGAARLADGTIASTAADPVYVGRGVIAEGFVFASGSRVADGAVVHHCFIGQATRLTNLFSAHDSLFFANCSCENGEAAAIFGGPYTVTMHKSSLLIAGMFSFLNAGSGSNQSNHMYKLGPIHQGVVERGSKTTSDSYILWPAKIGAFSLVMGRHVNHPDTSRLPFSYLIEGGNESFLVPGINLRSVGTIRDAQKWPKRDKRRDPDRLDCINFNLLSPYTAGKMMSGIRLLDDLERTAGLTAGRFAFQTMTIDAHALRKGRDLYRLAIDKFMGNSVIHRLGTEPVADNAELTRRLQPTHPAGTGRWVDICGMFAPKTEVDKVCDHICDGTIDSLEALESRWRSLHADYYDMEWTWVAEKFESWYGKALADITPADIHAIIDRWLASVTSLNAMLLEDARKEYSLRSRTGFGIDAPDSEADDDFNSVRGQYRADPFVEMVTRHSATKTALAGHARSLLPS